MAVESLGLGGMVVNKALVLFGVAALCLIGDRDGRAETVVLDVHVAQGAHFVFQGRELVTFSVQVDTVLGTMAIDGTQIGGRRLPSDDDCFKRWGRVKFVARKLENGATCREALEAYDDAVAECVRRVRAAMTDSEFLASASEAKQELLLWECVRSAAQDSLVRKIVLAHGSPRILFDGAPMPLVVRPRPTESSTILGSKDLSNGIRLLEYAEHIAQSVESPSVTPVLVAVSSSGGGYVRCVGEESVAEALRQVWEYRSNGKVGSGPLPENCLR
jgi:hypothetical protein